MDPREAEFFKRLLNTFKIEAEEHISTISQGLFELEKAADKTQKKELVEVIFREAHSLKGAARSVNLVDIEGICQGLEGCFAALKREEIKLTVEVFDLFHYATEWLNQITARSELQILPSEKQGILELRTELEQAAKGGTPTKSLQAAKGIAEKAVEGPPAPTAVSAEKKAESPAEPIPPRETVSPAAAGSISQGKPKAPDAAIKTPAGETIRLPLSRLDTLMRESEELISIKLKVREYLPHLVELREVVKLWKERWVKGVSLLKSRQRSFENLPEGADSEAQSETAKQLTEFIDYSQLVFKSLEDKLNVLKRIVKEDSYTIDGLISTLVDDMKELLMLPFSSVTEGFSRLVRDISREQGKEVLLTITGKEIEIDKRVLQEIKDPLIHLVRNCLDHGIETAEERKRKGKPPQGKLDIHIVLAENHKVKVTISDDGAGIDIAAVKKLAVQQGVLAPEEVHKLSDSEARALIFHSGLSTSPIITTLSGRGLGLAIVKENVERLGGMVSVHSETGRGTQFSMILPLTLATFRGIIVLVSGSPFAVPTAQVERVCHVKKESLQTIENKPTIVVDGRAFSAADLAEVLGLPPKPRKGEETDKITLLMLGSFEKQIAFIVDAVIREEDMVVKNLGKQLLRVKNISGVSLLGTGKTVPILNVSDLLTTAIQMTSAPSLRDLKRGEAEFRKKSVLVVEDSITARTLLKNVLESAGFNVKTAIDGLDALTIMQNEGFDLITSDIRMPRMDGFEFTAKIRSMPKYAELPVILITGLESPADKKRGIEVGATAYIVKKSFDQSNLLDIISRLI